MRAGGNLSGQLDSKHLAVAQLKEAFKRAAERISALRSPSGFIRGFA